MLAKKHSLADIAIKMQNPEELLTPEEAALFLRTTKWSLAAYRQKNMGPKYVKMGGRVYYRPKDLKKFIEESIVDPNETN